jgi:hypothetical protein
MIWSTREFFFPTHIDRVAAENFMGTGRTFLKFYFKKKFLPQGEKCKEPSDQGSGSSSG